MTKADLIEKVFLAGDYTQKQAAQLVESVFELLKATLASGENVKISGFGTFELKEKAARTGRNPMTGGSLVIGARRVLSFHPSARLKSVMNGQ